MSPCSDMLQPRQCQVLLIVMLLQTLAFSIYISGIRRAMNHFVALVLHRGSIQK